MRPVRRILWVAVPLLAAAAASAGDELARRLEADWLLQVPRRGQSGSPANAGRITRAANQASTLPGCRCPRLTKSLADSTA